MNQITVTTKAGNKLPVTVDAIDHIRPGMFECEIVLIDGTRVKVQEDFEEIRRRIRAAP